MGATCGGCQLVDRKRTLRGLAPRQPSRLQFVDHIVGHAGPVPTGSAARISKGVVGTANRMRVMARSANAQNRAGLQ